MSLLHTELMDSSNQCIKNEIVIKEEYVADEILVPELNALLDPSCERAKCGDIFISNEEHFILACGFCDDRFHSMQTFGEHIRNKHLCGEQRYLCHREARTEVDPSKSFTAPRDTKPEPEQIFASCKDESHSSPYENISTSSDSDSGEATFNNKNETIENPDNFCATCNRQYKDRLAFRRHQRRHSKPENRPDLYCELCHRQFKTKYNFRHHASRHDTIPLALQQDPGYLKCKYCDKKCANHRQWDEHERSHNGRFLCPYCSKCFDRNSERQLHINTHTGERPFKCDKCPLAFAHATNLKRHIQVHLGNKRYVCDICDKRFHQNSERVGHMRTHTGERPFQCEECGRNFISSSKLTDHRRRHTGIKNFKCEICGNLFYSNKALKCHKVKHSDARPYQCTECGNRFPRRKSLIAHAKIHSDIKEYVCNICGKEFAQAAGLYSHKKSHGEKLSVK